MRYTPATHEKINSAYELLQGGTIRLDTFSQVATLLKGIHPEIDKKLALSSELLSKHFSPPFFKHTYVYHKQIYI